MQNENKKIKIDSLKRQNLLNEHSMEFVAEHKGVTYINDSIAINATKTLDSLNMINADVILIIGGIDNKTDYELLKEVVQSKVSKIVSIAPDNNNLLKSFLTLGVELSSANSVQEAVEYAYNVAENFHVVLFSPACPSYHPFDNYKNRGNDFKRIVHSLIK
jgi:UDP-N-acetylmuramoylalanine--D-glutamate ligase